MGTNFYARIIPKEKDIDNTLKVIREYLIGINPNITTDVVEEITQRIHLGKRSAGWQFLWQENNKYYKDNLKSIKKFLSRKDVLIYDEYGTKFTVDELFDEELKDCLYNDKNHINTEQYYKKYPQDRVYDTEQWTTKDGLRFTNREFC